MAQCATPTTVIHYVMKADGGAHLILQNAIEIPRHCLSFKGGARRELEELAAALPFRVWAQLAMQCMMHA